MTQNTETFEPTMNLRWRVSKDLSPVLQQQWQGSNGSQKWENVEYYLED